MIDISRIKEVTETIKETSEVGLKFFSGEFEKFMSNLEDAVKAFNEESVKIKKELFKEIQELEKIKKEKKKVEEEYTIYSRKIDRLNKREKEVKEKEESLLELHKILDNKRKMQDAKEKELNNRGRRTGGTS